MRIFNKFKGTRGFLSLYERVLRFRYMITEQAKERCRILAFWERHGDEATQEAFKVSRRTLFRWQKKLNDSLGKLEEVVPFTIKRVQTDNGLEFEKYFRDYLNLRNILHFHNYPKCPKMNAFIERFNRTIQEDFINSHLLHLKEDITHFNRDLIDWLLWYNTKRPHESLGMVSPLRYIVMTLPAEECQKWWTCTFYCLISFPLLYYPHINLSK